jgi:hypothetical protein
MQPLRDRFDDCIVSAPIDCALANGDDNIWVAARNPRAGAAGFCDDR